MLNIEYIENLDENFTEFVEKKVNIWYSVDRELGV